MRASDRDAAEGERAAEPEYGEVVSLCDAAENVEEPPRIEIGGQFEAVDKMLNGGIVEDSVTLLSGPPGRGKSTLTLQILHQIARTRRVLYVSCEESIKQVSRRSNRLGLSNQPKLKIVELFELEEILDKCLDIRADLIAIDSVQKITCTNNDGEELEAGTGRAIKIALSTITKFAQREGVAFIVIGHVTKDGAISGPRSLEHDVDAVFFFDGREKETSRYLKCEHKNRNGESGPNVYVRFDMTDKGLVAISKEENTEFPLVTSN